MKKRTLVWGIVAILVVALVALNLTTILNKTRVSVKKSTPGSLVYWGVNEHRTEGDAGKPAEVFWIPNIKKLTAGHDHLMVLAGDGSAYTLGSNSFGQLGNSSEDFRENPEKIAFMDTVTDISANGHHSLAIDSQGNVWSWGLNLSSQIGNEKNDINMSPYKLTNLPKMKNVAAGYRFSVALAENGDVYAWGAACDPNKINDTQSVIRQFAATLTESGGYGDASSLSSQAYNFADDCNREKSTGINTRIAKKIEGMSGIKKISAGFGQTMALAEDGTVWMLGCNKYGQIGNGTFENAFTAEHRTELKDIVDIAAGYRHSLALDKEGNVWAWGFNGTGQLGLNSDEWRVVPTKIPSLTGVTAIAAGYDYSLALTKDGTVWGWGANASSQISSQKIAKSKVPIKLDMISNAKLISAGGTQAMAVIKE